MSPRTGGPGPLSAARLACRQTANLAAFFTASGITVNGPKDMSALRTATACFGAHLEDAAALARLENSWGVGSMLGGAIASNMPSEVPVVV